MNRFTRDLMKKIGFDEIEQSFFFGCSIKYDYEETYKELLVKFNEDVWENLEYVNDGLSKLAQKHNDNVYTLTAIFILDSCEYALPKFLAQGNSEELFYKTMSDIKIKLDECKQCYGIFGVSSPLAWFAGFYEPSRYWLGRLQFEVTKFKYGNYEKEGVSIKKDDPVINIHIPSGEPMLMEDCFKSYDLACEHYKDMYEKQGYLVFVCNSWLLFEKHREFLSPTSNISKFMDHFDIIDTTEEDTFGNGWRVFGSGNNADPTKLPEDSSLQRAYKKWICDGNKCGFSYGVRVHKIGDR
ncbi:MAG: acyltransferase domain-containing protein [Monoglobales bacterium]